MAISISGLGQFDWQSMVSQLKDVEQTRLTPLNNTKAQLQNKNTAWGNLSTKLTNFQNSINDIKDTEDYATFKVDLKSSLPTTPAEKVLSVTTDKNSVVGQYDIVVNSMAKAEKLQGALKYNNLTDSIGKSGTLTINDKTIALDGTENLSQVMSKINNADSGTVASAVKDKDGKYNLILSSKTTGKDQIRMTDLDDPLFSVTKLQDGKNAQITIDGIEVESTSNTITGAANGLTINVLGESTGNTITASTTRDTEALKAKIQKVVDNYNDIASYITSQNSYNTTTKKTGGALFGNSVLRQIKQDLTKVFGNANLSDYGLSFNDKGSLSVDTTKLNTSLNSNLDSTISKFTSLGTTLESMATNYINNTISTEQKSLESSVKKMDERIVSTQSKIDRKMELYRKQFMTMDDIQSKLMSNMSMFSASI